MFIMYTMMMFTDFLPDLDARKIIGYVSIVLVSLHLLVSFAVMLVDSAIRSSKRIKLYLIRRKNIKVRQAIQEKAITEFKPHTILKIIQEVDASLEQSDRSSASKPIKSRRSDSSINSRLSMLRPYTDINPSSYNQA